MFWKPFLDFLLATDSAQGFPIAGIPRLVHACKRRGSANQVSSGQGLRPDILSIDRLTWVETEPSRPTPVFS